MQCKKEKLDNFIVAKLDTLSTAMSKIEINRNRTIIVAESFRIYGVLTDGDIRKALLNGRSLKTVCEVVMNRNFKIASTEEEARDLLDRNLELNMIPICETSTNLMLSAIFTRF